MPDGERLVRDKDIFLPSHSSNTPNCYSSNLVRFSGNKAAGGDPNRGVLTVIPRRRGCSFRKESAPKTDYEKGTLKQRTNLYVTKDHTIPFLSCNKEKKNRRGKKGANRHLCPSVQRSPPRPTANPSTQGILSRTAQKRFKRAA